MAVAVAGSPQRAVAFLKSAERQEARRVMVRALDALPHADDLDILNAAKELIVAVKAPLAEVKSTQEAVLSQNADYLSRGALKQLEDRQKRELNARERSGIMEVLASARSLLRDVLVVREGIADGITNTDVAEVSSRLAAKTDTPGAVGALDAVARAERAIARNSTPQLTLEVNALCYQEGASMPLVVPVKFPFAARELWFDPQGLDIVEGDYAVCSTERGTELGLVTEDRMRWRRPISPRR